MNKKEIKKYVEDDIAFHCDEFGLQREEAIDVAVTNNVYLFFDDLLSEKDLIQYCEYLNYDLDIDKVREEKIKYTIKKQKYEYYHKHGRMFAKTVKKEEQ